MQFNENYALRIGDTVAVVRPRKKAQTFKYENEHLVEIEHNKELERNALAFVIGLNYLYDKQLFR
jgi:hypothetical protein